MTRLFVNRLTVIDCSYLDPDRGLLGESWLVDLELEGSLDDQGMVVDFGLVKRRVKQTIDERFDHRLLLPGRYPGIRIEDADGRRLVHFIDHKGFEILHRSPTDAVCAIDAETVTPEALERAITAVLAPQLPRNVAQVRVRIRAELIDGAFYRYSHGLQHHDGNCQRIAHGHRSRIEILRDGARSPALETVWATRWRDCYIATRSHLQAELTRGGIAYLRFGYEGSQGRFELELPRSRCYLIDHESTVENLACHVAERLGADEPGHQLLVRAFEGVDKGAVASAGPHPTEAEALPRL